MAIIRILDLKQKRREKRYPVLENALEGAPIKLCASGCSHCSAMRRNVIEAVEKMGLPEGSLECYSKFEDIARLGVMATPSLIVNGKLVSSGKVLKAEQIISLIGSVMEQDKKSES